MSKDKPWKEDFFSYFILFCTIFAFTSIMGIIINNCLHADYWIEECIEWENITQVDWFINFTANVTYSELTCEQIGYEPVYCKLEEKTFVENKKMKLHKFVIMIDKVLCPIIINNVWTEETTSKGKCTKWIKVKVKTV